MTRLSLGVQSFRDEELRRLGRLHTADRAIEAFGLARTAGFDDISIDLNGFAIIGPVTCTTSPVTCSHTSGTG